MLAGDARVNTQGPRRPTAGDPVGALAMLPVVLLQGWETLKEAREGDDDG